MSTNKNGWDNPINMSIPWDGNDNTNNLPVKGTRIEEFLKKQLQSKVGATYFDDSTMTQYQFASVEDKDSWLADKTLNELIIGTDTFKFSGKQQQMSVVDKMGNSLLYFATNQNVANITVGFKSEQKSVTETVWEEIIEDALFTVYVDKGKVGNFSPIAEDVEVFYGSDYTIDVFKYIAVGENRIRFKVKGKYTGNTATRTYQVNLTSMYLSANAETVGCYKPFIEGNKFALSFNIGGNISKVLKVRITGEGYERNKTVNIGNGTYVNTAYGLNIDFPSTTNNELSGKTNYTGVYNVETYLDANGLISDILTYQIICVQESDRATAKLVCVNEILNPVINGDNNNLFAVGLYNKGTGEGDITIVGTVNGSEILNTTQTIDTGTRVVISNAIDYTSEATSGLEINISVTGDNTVEWAVPLDNTLSYPPVAGYKFYMNEATRSNGESNKEYIVNIADGSLIQTDWDKIAFIGDGHDIDDNGVRCLHIPAGSSATLNESFLYNIGATGKTIEMSFKIANVSDFEENIITIFANNIGLQIKPRNVKLYSQKLYENDYAQSYNIKEDEFVHLLVTIVPDYKTNYGNLAQIYVNGVKKTSFEYDAGDSFQTNARLVLGSSSADLYLYKMRVYDVGFEWPAVIQNFINSLHDRNSKLLVYDRVRAVLDDGDRINYDACVKAGLNTMVIEMLDGAKLPDKLNPTEEVVPKCNVTFNIHNKRDDELDDEMYQLLNNLKLTNQSIEGQGTTAMTYYRWNFRWKLSKIIENKRRITAKKNVASSPHSHKMGATRMFNELHNAIVGNNDVKGRVAVSQYPVYGFLAEPLEGATGQYSYTYIGLYTVGPDKGDSHTFGYDDSTYESSIIHLEGTDHNVIGVGFDYPWIQFTNELGVKEWTIVYDASAEGLGVVGKESNATPWEVGQAGELETDSDSDASAVQEMLIKEFKPAYDCVYNNSTAIIGVTETLEQINIDPAAWNEKIASDGRKYSSYEFWTDGIYDLYYYNKKYEKYMPNGMNLLTQLGIEATTLEGLTVDEKNEVFKEARRTAFKNTWTNYWDADDALFHDVFLELIGATDNFKKNNYPYKIKPLAEGGRWQRRQDDLDTIFDINNQGYATKKYSILIGDTTDSGAIFRGEDSLFHTLVHECFKEEKKAMAHKIFDKMAEFSKHGTTSIEKLIGYVKTCCWDYAQDYFSESAYNTDAEWTYEEAWALWGDEYENDVNPLQQSLGSHYEAEKNWVELRLPFMASYYNWGPFAKDHGDDNSAGTISFRAASGKTFSLTPAIDFNPTILIGQNDLVYAGGRNEANTAVNITVPDMGQNDTHIYIQGTDYLSDLGDLDDLKLSTDNSTLAISAKRLKKLKIGDSIANNVTSNITLLNLGKNPTLEEVDARNLTSLANASIDFTGSPRVRKAYFKGTNIKGIKLLEGSKIVEMSLPDTITDLSLVRLPYLTTENLDYGSLENLASLRVENSVNIDPFEMLRVAYNSSSVLKGIRILNFNKNNGTREDLDMLYALATEVDEYGNRRYQGLDDKGTLMTGEIPVISGNLTMTEIPFENDYNTVNDLFPNVVKTDELYVSFIDPAVADVLKLSANAMGGDGTGVPISKLNTITSTKYSLFSENASITDFSDFYRYTTITTINSNTFNNCSNLINITLPDKVNIISSSAFRNCKALEAIKIPSSVASILGGAFNGSGLTAVYIDDLEAWCKIQFGDYSANPFAVSKNLYVNNKLLEHVVIPDTITKLLGYTFYNGHCIKEVTINNPIEINTTSFQNCNNITKVHIPNFKTWLQCNIGQYNPTQYSKALYINGEKLTEVTIPKEITSIGSYVFNSLTLDKVYYEGTLEDYLKVSFKDTTSSPTVNNAKVYINNELITNLVIPTGTTSILKYAFRGWKWVNSIEIPNTVKTIEGNVFSYTNIRNIVIPEGVTSIGGSTFAYCTNLNSITLPSTLTSIGEALFDRCTSLLELTIPDNVTTLKGSMNSCIINKCTSLTKLDLGNGIKTIPRYAFALQDFTEVTVIIGTSVTSIEDYAFGGTKNYTKFIIKAVTPPSITAASFSNYNVGIAFNSSFYVPDESVDAYKTATNWISYAAFIKPLSEYVE